MSGTKTITIDRSEYARLQAAESRLRSVQSDLPEVIAAAGRQSQQELTLRLAPLQQRQKKFEVTLSHLSTDVQAIERETVRRFEDQQRQFRRELQESEASVRQELNYTAQQLWEEIAGQEERLGARIDAERTARQRQIEQLGNDVKQRLAAERAVRQKQFNHLQRQFDALGKNEKRKADLAKAIVSDADVLASVLQDSYRHDVFAPGRLSALNQTLAQARTNIAQGVYETAIGQAQEAYRGLSELRVELEYLEYQWEWYRSSALTSAREIIALAKASRRCSLEVEGQDTGIEEEVDYWTRGSLSRLEKEVATLLAPLEETHCQYTSDELRALMETTLPGMRKRLGEVITSAKTEILSSQLRANIAQLVVEALMTQGYDLADTTYEGQDMRALFAAKVEHPDGGEVIVEVEPVPEAPGQNRVKLLSYDEKGITDSERQVRAREVHAALKEQGLAVGMPQADAAEPDPAEKDISIIRKRQPVSQPTKTVSSTATETAVGQRGK